MSHFVGLVFGKNIEEQLKKYDENLCEVFKDCTEEAKKEYEEGMYGEYKKVNPNDIFSESKLVSEIPFKEKYITFADFCKEYYGYEIIREGASFKCGYMTNPDAKWDWYQEGGRWAGWLHRKPLEQCKFPDLIRRGSPSLLMDNFSYKDREVDSCALCDVDWESMKKFSMDRAAAYWDEEEKKRQLHPDRPSMINWGRTVEQGPYTREEYINESASVTPYCYIVEGKWCQKGEMGWFGMSSNEVSCEQWAKEFELMLNELPEDTQVTVIDFHI